MVSKRRKVPSQKIDKKWDQSALFWRINGMLRGVVGTNEKKKTEEDKKEDELEEEIVLEILREGRGEREERGERDEWNQHVGWHRKEDVDLNQKGHPQKQDQNNGINKKLDHQIDHAIKETGRHNAKEQRDRGHNRPLRKRKHEHADSRKDIGLDRYGTETAPLRSSGVFRWAILAMVVFGFLIWWNKNGFRRNYTRNRIRKWNTKGRTL